MNKNEVINVTVNPDGTVEVDAVGFKGKGCKAATEFLEKALGMDTTKSKKKPEFDAVETVRQTQRA